MWLIDAWELCKHANNQLDKKLSVNDIMNFPRVEAVSIDAMANRLAEVIGKPCNISPIDEMVVDVCGETCEFGDCEPTDEQAAECWRRWIYIYVNMEEQQNE